MKKIFTLICCVTFALSSFAQTNVTKVNKKTKTTATKSSTTQVAAVASSETPAESLTLKEKEFDFGKIPQGKLGSTLAGIGNFSAPACLPRR